MNSDMDTYLCSKYPRIFRDRHKPMTETCMCWGLECGPGWKDLLDRGCAKVQATCDEYQVQLVCSQVKEKFGYLSFYYDLEPTTFVSPTRMARAEGAIAAIVDGLEAESADTCEVCGKPGKINKKGYWLSCRCPECRKKETGV